MFEREDELSQLRQKIHRRASLKTTLAALEEERKTLEEEVRQLKTAAEAEQTDVDRLEGFSLQNLIYNMTGQKGELLEKERREADVAWMEHDFTATRLSELTVQLEQCRAERTALYDCEQTYWQLLEEALSAAEDPGPIAEEMLRRLEQVQNELTAAIGQAIAAKEMGLNVLESLQTIDGYNQQLTGTARANTVDSYLLGAKAKMDRFRLTLEELNCTLNDHALTAPLSRNDLLELEPLQPEDLRSHGAIALRIHQCESAVRDTRRKIKDILDQLEAIASQKLLRQLELQKLVRK